MIDQELLGKSLNVREEEISKWKNDPHASKRTIPVYINKDKYIDVEVYNVPLNFPIYRLENIRTESDQESYLSRNKAVSKDFFNDPECRDALIEQHKFLFRIANSGGDKNHFEVFKKEKFKVDEELILNSKGILLNGNTRVSALRELYNENKSTYSHFQSLPMAILPSNLSEENEKYIELSLQVQPDRKKDYKWTSEALSVRKRLNRGDGIEEIINDFKRKANSIGHPKNLLNQLLMADEYLISIDKNGDYELLLKNQYALMEIYKVWDKLKNNLNYQKWWMILCNSELTKSRKGKQEGSDYRNYKEWGINYLKDPNVYISQLEYDNNDHITDIKPDKPKSDDIFNDLFDDDFNDDHTTIPDPDKIQIDPKDLGGILKDGTEIIKEEEKRNKNRNQLYDDVNNSIKLYSDNIEKINDSSNEFDKIEDTINDLDKLLKTINDFKETLLNKYM